MLSLLLTLFINSALQNLVDALSSDFNINDNDDLNDNRFNKVNKKYRYVSIFIYYIYLHNNILIHTCLNKRSQI